MKQVMTTYAKDGNGEVTGVSNTIRTTDNCLLQKSATGLPTATNNLSTWAVTC